MNNSEEHENLLEDSWLENLPVHESLKTVGPVVLYRKLGSGGMGAVYKGRHLRLNVPVAVKIMSPELTGDPSFTERFVREAQVAVTLNHPNLVRCFDVNTEAGLNYMILEFIEGRHLSEYLAARGTPGLSDSEISGLIDPVASALSMIHSRGVVHRDIKLDNIMLADTGRVVLMDLGLAKIIEQQAEDLTLRGQALGTPMYMAPEQWFDAKNVGPAADIWSLGVCMYELATGTVPWNVESMSILLQDIMNKEAADPRNVNPALGRTFTDLLYRCLDRDPDKRITSFELEQRLGVLGDSHRLPTQQLVDGEAKTVMLPDKSPSIPTALAAKVAEGKKKSDKRRRDKVRKVGVIRAALAVFLVVLTAGLVSWRLLEKKRRSEAESERNLHEIENARRMEQERRERFTFLESKFREAIKKRDCYSARVFLEKAVNLPPVGADREKITGMRGELEAAEKNLVDECFSAAETAAGNGNFTDASESLAKLSNLKMNENDVARISALKSVIERGVKRAPLLAEAEKSSAERRWPAALDALKEAEKFTAPGREREETAALRGEVLRRKDFYRSVDKVNTAIDNGDFKSADELLPPARAKAVSPEEKVLVEKLFDTRRLAEFEALLAEVGKKLNVGELDAAAELLDKAENLADKKDAAERSRLDAGREKLRAVRFASLLSELRAVIKRGNTAAFVPLLKRAEAGAVTNAEKRAVAELAEACRALDFNEAMDTAEKALKSKKYSAAAKALKSAGKLAFGDDEKARWNKLASEYRATVHELNIDRLIAASEKALGKGRWKEAEKLLEQANGFEPAGAKAQKISEMKLQCREGRFREALGQADAAALRGEIADSAESVKLAVKIQSLSSPDARGWLEKLEKEGNSVAALLLFKMTKDSAHLLRSAKLGHPAAQYISGKMLLADKIGKQYAEAVVWLKRAAEKEYPPALIQLGECYATGVGVGKDPAAAVSFYEKAAAAGELPAMRALGDLYRNPRSGIQDYRKAFTWYGKASAAGDDYSTARLGECFFFGRGTGRDTRRGGELFRKAAIADNALGKYRLGTCRLSGEGAGLDTGAGRKLVIAAAEAGCPEALETVADWRFQGEGLPLDRAEAVVGYKRAAEAGIPSAQVKLGDCYRLGTGVGKNPPAAVEWYRRASSAGLPEAYCRLGEAFRRGEGVARNYAAAFSWFNKAVEAGFPPAYVALGDMYAAGEGVPADKRKAFEYWMRAAETGDAIGQYRAGAAYRNGVGVSVQTTEARRWLQAAATKGNAEAEYLLGEMEFHGEGTVVNKAAALKLYRKAADAGYSGAQNRLGEFLLHGWEIPADQAEAVKLFRAAAAAGNPAAMNNLGECCVKGIGLKRDNSEAFRWFEKSAAAGYAPGLVNSGDCYRFGRGTKRNYAKAAEHYITAADKGFPGAQYRLGLCYSNGWGVKKSAKTAFENFHNAALQGLPEAQYELGRCYERGIGVRKDASRALSWYKKAARAGHKEAKKKVTTSGSPW